MFRKPLLIHLAAFLCWLAAASCQKSVEFNFDFESDAALDKLHWKCGTLYSLSREHATSGKSSLKMDLYPATAGNGNIYPGVCLRDFSGNWSQHSRFLFDVYNPQASPLYLTLRVDDTANPTYADRFNGKIEVMPGANKIVVPFEKFVTSGTGRHLDVRNIESVSLFMVAPDQPLTFFIDHFRLE